MAELPAHVTAGPSFNTLPLSPAMLENLQRLGYTAMTPIQAGSLPFALAGHDLIAQAKTGSGKTAAGKDGAAAGKDGNGASVNVTSAQRTRVKTVFTRQKPAAQNVNVDVRVGVAVPRTVRLAVVPEDVVVIVPAYRKYRHFGVGNQVCIVDPVTYAIVGWLKRREHEDWYDRHTDFTPFSLKD